MVAKPPTTNHKLQILLTTYQTDRADQASANLTSVTLVSIGAAYIAIVLSFAHAGLPRALLLALPLAPVALCGFLVQLGTAVVTRAEIILLVEKELAQVMGRSDRAIPASFAASNRFFGSKNSGYRGFLFTTISALTYAAVLALVGIFVWRLACLADWERASTIVVATSYYLFLALVGVAFAVAPLSSAWAMDKLAAERA